MLSKLRRWLEAARQRWWPFYHDQSDDAGEAFYASFYLKNIYEHLPPVGDHEKKRVLDVGCGTGRILVPLVKAGYSVTGIERHKGMVKALRSKIAKWDIGGDTTIVTGDLTEVIVDLPERSYDVVLALEVLYTVQARARVVDRLADLTVPGGRLFITHRTRFYFLMYCLRHGRYEEARTVATENQGRLTTRLRKKYFNWQTVEQIERYYGESDRMSLVETTPIGPYSGSARDPLAPLCDPGCLSADEREHLRFVEEHYDSETMATARYILAVVERL